MLLDLHLFFIWTTLALVAFADEQGLIWMRGIRATLPHARLEWLHVLIGIGLSCLIATGGLLFLRAPSFYFAQAAFIPKIIFVGVLILNSFFVGRFTRVASTRAWKDLAQSERVPLIASGAISFISWSGAVIFGLLLR